MIVRPDEYVDLIQQY